jgi:hypothetical protein
MLPGTRTYSDEDIVSIARDSLSVFGQIEDELGIPADLRVSVFGICHTMVGNRQIAADMGALVASLPELRRKQ